MSLIEITNLSKVFESEDGGAPTVALQGVNCHIEKGELVAIVGPSGSGKSTLLQMLGLLDRPTGGTYRFNGTLVDEFSDDEQALLRNNSLGFIFQSFNLLPRTSVLENVKLPLAYSRVPIGKWDALAKSQIEAVGLTQRMTHEPSQLSGGERQRVAIARALVNGPDIIFADEPTGNLDSVSGKKVIEILCRLNCEEGHTIVLITHDKRIAQTAGRIISLRDGEIVWDGKAKDYVEQTPPL
jgi:ABC-type lipoprotein export system ATPase subunit